MTRANTPAIATPTDTDRTDAAGDLRALFRDEVVSRYDFAGAPRLVRGRSGDELTTVYGTARVAAWARAQKIFMAWTRERAVFTEETVARGKQTYDEFFAEHDLLRGQVLDIGGGWGLYREWWTPDPSDLFVVHDPGVERFLAGPHEHHKRLYARAFALPMSFVEGFGETLPYVDRSFDRCVIAASLDHCLDPARVLAECRRCLRPGGKLLLLQHCHAEHAPAARPESLVRRLLRALRSPRRAVASAWLRLRYPDVHLHHFRVSALSEALHAAGFSSVEVEPGPDGGDSFRFIATTRPEPQTS